MAVTDGGWWVTDGGWCVTDGGWCVTDGGWCVTDGGWWVATKHQRVAALVKKKKRLSVLMATPAVRFQGRADYRQPPNPTEAQVGGRYRRPVCRRARGQGCGRGLGLARGGQVWPGAPGPVGRPWEPDAEPTRE